MSIERVNSVYDVPALKGEFDFVLKSLEGTQAAIVKQFETINSYKGTTLKTLAADSEKVAVAFDKTVDATDKMSAAQKKFEEAMARATMESIQTRQNNVNLQKTYQDMSGSIEQNIRLQLKYRTELEALKKQQKELSNAFGGSTASAEALRRKQIEVAQAIEENKNATSELGRTIRLQVKEQQAAGGSLDEMKAKYDRLYQVLRGLSDSDRESHIGKNLNKDLEELSNNINEIQKSAGNFSQNVGRYAGSLGGSFKILTDELTKIRSQLDGMDSGSAGFDELVKQEKMLTTLTEGLNREFGSATQEVRALQKAASSIGLEFGITSEVFTKFRDEVGKGVDAVGDIRAQINLAASDTRALDGMIGAAEGLAGAYSVAEGSAALFGGASEELMKTMVKLQAVMSILQGLQAIRNALQAESAAMDFLQTARLKALTIAQSLYTYVMNGATVAAKAFRAAQLATGIGAIIAVIYFAVKAWQQYSKATGEAAKASERQAAISEKAADGYIKEKVQMEQLTATVNKGSLSFSEKEKVLKDYNETFGKSIGKANSFEEAEKKIIELGPAYIEMLQLQAEAQASFDLALEETKKKLKAQQEGPDLGAFDALKIGLKNAFGGIGSGLTDIVAIQQEQVKESADNATAFLKINEEASAKADAIKKKYGFKGEDDAKKENKSAEDASKKKKELAERDAKALYDVEQQSLKIKSDTAKRLTDQDSTMYGNRLAALLQWQGTEEEIAVKERDFLLKNTDLTENEKAKIKQDAEIKLTDITRAGMDARTALMQKQVEDEKAYFAEMAAGMEANPEQRTQQRETVIKNTSSIFDKINLTNSTEYTEQLNGLTELLTNSEISIEEFQKRKEALTLKYNRRELSNAISLNEALISNLKGLGFDTVDLEKQLNEQKAKLYEEDAANFAKTQDEKRANLEKGLQLVQNLQQNVMGAIGEILTISLEKQKVAIEEMEASQQKTYEAEVARITNSTLTEEEKANKLKILEAERMAQKEANERRQRKLDIERARFQKIQDIGNIITGTAIAVVSALGAQPFTPANIALAAVVGALGAAQLARAIATPLPKFADGTESAPGGYAITDEKGAEMYIEPGGKAYMGSNQGPVMRYLKPGTKVIPADEVNQAMNAQMMAETARRLQFISGYERKDESEAALTRIEEAILQGTEANIREMRKQKRNTKVVNQIDLGWAKYIQEKTFN